MIGAKVYIAKATKTNNGVFVSGEPVEISQHFKGAHYKKAEGLESYGKTRMYIETFPEEKTPDIYFHNTLETSEVTLTIYFFDKDKHKNDSDAIKAIDQTYHAFVEYITGTYIKYWDNVRQRKVMLAYKGETKPTVDNLYGIIYKEVSFKFTNVYGKSFNFESTEF